MVADKQEKRLVADKRLRAKDGVAVAQRRALLDELKPGRMAAGRRRVGRLVTRPDDHADLFDARHENLFDERRQGRLLNAIAINQSLERQRALAFSSGGDDCFSNFHASAGSCCAPSLTKFLVAVNSCGHRSLLGGADRPGICGSSAW